MSRVATLIVAVALATSCVTVNTQGGYTPDQRSELFNDCLEVKRTAASRGQWTTARIDCIATIDVMEERCKFVDAKGALDGYRMSCLDGVPAITVPPPPGL